MSRVRSNKAKAAGDELVNLNARVARSVIKRVRAHCVQADVTMREFITSALEQHLGAKKRHG
jgi:hypothetical protein